MILPLILLKCRINTEHQAQRYRQQRRVGIDQNGTGQFIQEDSKAVLTKVQFFTDAPVKANNSILQEVDILDKQGNWVAVLIRDTLAVTALQDLNRIRNSMRRKENG